MNRRTLLNTTGLLAASALIACTISTNGGVTTATLDVASVNSYAQAIINTASALLGAPAVAALLGGSTVIATTAMAGIVAALSAFNTASGGSITVTVDTSGVVAAADTILADGQQLLSLFQRFTVTNGSVLTASASAVATLADALAAMQTVVALLQAMMAGLSGAVAAPVTPMTRARALSVAGVRAR